MEQTFKSVFGEFTLFLVKTKRVLPWSKISVRSRATTIKTQMISSFVNFLFVVLTYTSDYTWIIFISARNDYTLIATHVYSIFLNSQKERH